MQMTYGALAHLTFDIFQYINCDNIATGTN